MKIVLHEIEKVAIEDFADKHDLAMEVHERDHSIGDSMRYYAKFSNAETKHGSVLAGVFGNGPTIDDAIEDYAMVISGKLFVIDAMKPTRREIQVPWLYYRGEQ